MDDDVGLTALSSWQLFDAVYDACGGDATADRSVRGGTRAWTLWQAAQFCIVKRLRTHLGNAMQTFEAIQKALQLYDRNLNPAKPEDLQKPLDLLQFVHDLEILVCFIFFLFISN